MLKQIIKLSDIVYFSQFNEKQVNYYFNLSSYKIDCVEDIIATANISMEYFLCCSYDYNYIPLPLVNKYKILNSFVESLNNKRLSSQFSEFTDFESLWIAFDKCFPVGMERRLWSDYYKNASFCIAEQWCHDNNIRYIKD